MQKSRFTYSTHNQQLTALFLVIFELLCLTSYPRFWTNSRKMYYLCRRKAASQQNIQASLIFCIRFAFSLHRQPMKVLREPLRGHLLRPRAVTIDDRRRSSIKTQKVALSGSWQSHASTRQRRRARHLSQPNSHNFSYFMNTK